MSRRQHNHGGTLLPIAHNGSRAALHRVIDMIDQGHSTDSIRAWAVKEIHRMSPPS